MDIRQVTFSYPDHTYANTSGSFETIRINPTLSALSAPAGFESIAIPSTEVPWRVNISKKARGAENVVYFKVECNPTCESSLWSCSAIVDVTVINRDAEKNITHRVTQDFNILESSFEIKEFMNFDEMVNGGYVSEKGSIEVLLSLSTSKINGFPPVKHEDFSGPDEFSNAILIVEGRKLHVNKTYLSMYSPVFKSMFFSEFAEKNQKEITIQDVKYNDFVTLLNAVYPSHAKVTTTSVASLLELSDRFDISFVTFMCEKYLISNKTFSLIDKLVFADKYNLSGLQDRCIRSLRTMADCKELRKQPKYKELTDNTRKALIEKMFKLFP